MRGTATTDECEPLFKQYKTCLSVRYRPTPMSRTMPVPTNPIQKALKERGIDQMLDEARADNKENDAEYLKPSIR